jgi:hypothetical protein
MKNKIIANGIGKSTDGLDGRQNISLSVLKLGLKTYGNGSLLFGKIEIMTMILYLRY